MFQDIPLEALLSFAGMALTGIFGFITATKTIKKEQRQSLAEDERLFRAELRDMVETYQGRVVELTNEVSRLTRSNLQLEAKVQELTKQNADLTSKVQDLANANTGLRELLNNRG